MSYHKLSLVSLCLLGLFHSALAKAQPRTKSTEHRNSRREAPPVHSFQDVLQIGLSTALVGHSALAEEFETNTNGTQDNDVSLTTWGPAGGVTLELGYGISDQLLLGALLTIGGSSESNEQTGAATANTGQGQIQGTATVQLPERSTFTFLGGPKLDYMFANSSELKPYVGGAVLVHVLDSEIKTPDNNLNGSTKSSLGAVFLGRLGLRGFVLDDFSLDAALVGGFRIGSGSFEPTATPTDDRDFSISGFQVGIEVGLSGWVD